MDINSVTNSLQAIMQQLQSNPIIPLIASGGLTVWIITNLKSIWSVVRDFIVSLISFDIFNTYEDNTAQGYCLKWRQTIFNKLLTNSYSLWERTMNLDLSDDMLKKSYNNKITIETGLNEFSSLTYGFSIRIILGKLVFCNRTYKQDGQKILVNTSLRVFFASKRRFMKKIDQLILEDMKKYIESKVNRSDVQVFYGSQQYGGCSKKNKRLLDSIFTNNNEHIQLYNDIKKFIENKDTYVKMSYPYKYSALLEGVPGAGKSSTILAIASALNRDVEYINLSTSSVISLMDKLNNDTDGKIFVFEDIDALNSSSNENREMEKKEKNSTNQTCVINNNDGIKVLAISLSDLLNITDGLLSSDGAICIFTTNHIEKLDPALLRAGRMNKIIKFEYLNATTANKMIKTYLGHEIDNLKDSIKPAELQEDLLNIVLGRADDSVLNKFVK